MARKSHAHAPHANACSHGTRACDLRATVATNGRLDRLNAHHFETAPNDAIKPTVYRHNGSQITRSYTPREHRNWRPRG
eukprot:10497011-Lingulodinium_polyedra.AAC.1